MELADALAELGLTAGATEPEIRRAYLRRLKDRKPERDPVGFARLREAYDLLRTPTIFRVVLRAEPRAVVAPVETASAKVAKALDDGEIEHAALLVRKALRQWVKDQSKWRPPTEMALDLVLGLHEIGATVSANKLERRLRRTIEGERLPPVLASRWALVRELGALPEELTLDVRRALVRFAKTADFVDARAMLVESQAHARYAQTTRDRDLLRTYAPTFARSFATTLLPKLTLAEKIRVTGIFVVAFAVLVGVAELLPRRAQVNPHLAPAKTAVDAVVRDATEENALELATHASNLWVALDRADCRNVVQDVETLQGDLSKAPERLHPKLLEALAASREACPQ